MQINDSEFVFRPYLTKDDLRHKDQLLEIQSYISNALNNYPNYLGVDFCDVHAGGIQIRGHHKKITGYTYPINQQPTIDYDFGNYMDAAKEFVDLWKAYDNPRDVSDAKDFILAGEKYGWD